MLLVRAFFVQMAIALFIIGLLFYAFIKSLEQITHHGEQLTIPNVVGMPVARAIEILHDQHFNYKIDSVFVDNKPGGTVIEQAPGTKEKVKENRTVYLTMVSEVAPHVHLPKFEDTPYKEYESNLHSIGLSIDSIVYKPDVAKDLVLEVHYKGRPLVEGADLAKGSKVDLILGDGNGGEVKVPALVGLNVDEARFAIRGAQLLLGTITYQGNIADSSKLKVTAQNPSTDSIRTVSQGTVVDITLSEQ